MTSLNNSGQIIPYFWSMNHKILLCLFAWCICSCTKKEPLKYSDIKGLWKLELNIGSDEKTIPFFLEIIEINNQVKAAVWNGDEKIQHDHVTLRNDSVFIESPYFNSTLTLLFNRNLVSGIWQDKSREEYVMTVTGKYNLTQRFKFDGPLETNVDGKWEVRFSPNTPEEYKAIGLFTTDQNSMKGTFITETGDYRFLEGGFALNELKLSTFDGAHAFLFEADLKNDTLYGEFFSGKHYSEKFIAWRNDSAALMSPYKMTELVDPTQPISFSFKDLNGKVVSIDDSTYLNKPMLVQLSGSWCPNCMDESAFLVENKAFIAEKGVEVVALSFERLPYDDAVKPLLKLKESLGIEYPVLYAGMAKKLEATKEIPWLKEIKSYPTLLFVMPNKQVFKFHTGFYGPGTGPYYKKQSSELLDDITLLAKMSGVTP